MRKINLETISFRLLYYQYKDYGIYVGIIFVCIALLAFFIVPQFLDILSLRAEEQRYKDKNQLLKNNIDFINRLDDAVLNSQFNTATLALSSTKEYTGVLHSLSLAAQKSGVRLEDYTFVVGDLSTASASIGKNPSLEIDIGIVGDINSSQNFLNALLQQLPLAVITTFVRNGSTSSVHVQFPYKPYSVVKADYERVYKPLSQKDQDFLNKLQTWYSNAQGSILQASPSSPSTQ